MSFFVKIKDVTHVDSPEQFLQRGSNEIFSVSIIKISTLNKNVLNSEWTGQRQLVHSGWSAPNNR